MNVRRMMLILTAATATLAVLTAQAFSCPYSKLQVLVPGESAAPGDASGMTGYPESQVVGVPFQVLVRACDDDWQTVTSVKHVFRITSSDGIADLPPAEPMIGGQLVVTVILNSPGVFTITACDLTDGEHYSATSSEIDVIGGTGDTERIVFSVIDAGRRAGSPFAVEVRAVDHNGNTVDGFSESVSLSQITSLGEGRIQPESIDLFGGEWSGMMTLFLADESMTECTGGSVRISGVSGDSPVIQGMSNCFTVLPGDFARLQIVVPGQTRDPGTLQGLTGEPATQLSGYYFKVEIFATDEYWNRVQASDAVRLVTSDHAAASPLTGLLEDGYVSFSTVLVTPGTQTFTITDDTDCDIAGMTTGGIPVISDEPSFVIEPVAGPLTAGVPVLVTINVIDGDGELIDGYNGYAMLAADTGPGSISPETVRFSGGRWTGEMTFFGSSVEVLFSCIDFVVPPNIGTSNPVEVLPGEYAGLQVILPGEIPTGGMEPGFEGEPAAQSAGARFDLLLRAVDSWWNTVPDMNGTISIVPTDAFADIPEVVRLSGGEAYVTTTFYRAGPHTITVSDIDAEEEPVFSNEFSVRPGPYTQIIMLAPGEEPVPGSETGKAGAPLDQSISYSFTLKIVATDDWWNPTGGVVDIIEIVTTDPLAELPGGTAMNDGVAEIVVRLSTGGYQLLTARNVSISSMREALTQVRAINNGFHYEVAVDPARVIAGESFTLEVKVTNDAGAVMQEINSFATVGVLNADNGEPGGGTLLIPQFQLLQGKRTIRQTYTMAEPILLIISDSDGNAPGLTNVIEVDPGPPSLLTVESAEPWVGSRKSTIVTASVLDQYGNGVPGQPVLFHLAGSSGELIQIDEYTDELGLARAEFRSSYEPEIGTILVISGEFDVSMNIETAHVDPNSPGGSVTNYPNPFHPGEVPTTIAYMLDDEAAVTMKLFTLSGGLVFRKTYASGSPGGLSGLNEIQWNGRNGRGTLVASGGYVLFIEAVRSGETIHTMRRRIGVVR
ncbi:MAG: hypothetical protein KOO63_00015 [Bacteroidales bacterium]|nr:hypothetical protein [Candidatus Latescibacterota bacterium]